MKYFYIVLIFIGLLIVVSCKHKGPTTPKPFPPNPPVVITYPNEVTEIRNILINAHYGEVLDYTSSFHYATLNPVAYDLPQMLDDFKIKRNLDAVVEYHRATTVSERYNADSWNTSSNFRLDRPQFGAGNKTQNFYITTDGNVRYEITKVDENNNVTDTVYQTIFNRLGFVPYDGSLFEGQSYYTDEKKEIKLFKSRELVNINDDYFEDMLVFSDTELSIKWLQGRQIISAIQIINVPVVFEVGQRYKKELIYTRVNDSQELRQHYYYQNEKDDIFTYYGMNSIPHRLMLRNPKNDYWLGKKDFSTEYPYAYYDSDAQLILP